MTSQAAALPGPKGVHACRCAGSRSSGAAAAACCFTGWQPAGKNRCQPKGVHACMHACMLVSTV